jgi:hypothetical protein
VNCAGVNYSACGGRGWRRREDQGVAVGEDPDDVGAAPDLTVESFLLRVVELSDDAVDVRGDGRKPLTRSQTAKTISWTRIGRIRNA